MPELRNRTDIQMPSMKDESEGEGEEMSHDSNDSNQSSASCDSSAEHSDSDDSSEMDEDECERRRTECMENLVDLERQFTLLKEQLYRERITQVDTKLGEVRIGKSEEYLIPLERLKENMKTKTEVAGILKQLRLQNIHNKFLAEEQAAQQNFESEKGLVWDGIHSDLQEKIRRLEEDRNNVDIHADLWLSSSGRTRRNHSERRRAVSVAGPYIVYMLNDADILEDWALIKKSMSSRKTEIL
ncbi:breast cancer metastasis-suppressor 1-like protein isoform X2 [Venturia canescens]|uniref:breast cancer metastasis-suppressor 1-like protein isoform X2 n=1 Tax=Venturia canescens TaxID=32260 RepID=UPI001C9D38EF|nr:breast cancer metastasis-suppressor 1-like protein isoform X2 [Venturia canescens]